MSRISSGVARLVATAVTAYAAYELLLDDRAKEAVLKAAKRTFDAVGKSATKISGFIDDRMADADDGATSRAQAEEAWRRLGY